jgi:hypothetical protein
MGGRSLLRLASIAPNDDGSPIVVDGNLLVQGSVQTNGSLLTNAIATNSLAGNSLVVQSAQVAGALTAGSTNVLGALTAGSQTVTGNLTAGSATVTNVLSAGSATVANALTAGSLQVQGEVAAASLAPIGTAPLVIGGDLDMTGHAILNATSVGPREVMVQFGGASVANQYLIVGGTALDSPVVLAPGDDSALTALFALPFAVASVRVEALFPADVQLPSPYIVALDAFPLSTGGVIITELSLLTTEANAYVSNATGTFSTAIPANHVVGVRVLAGTQQEDRLTCWLYFAEAV